MKPEMCNYSECEIRFKLAVKAHNSTLVQFNTWWGSYGLSIQLDIASTVHPMPSLPQKPRCL